MKVVLTGCKNCFYKEMEVDAYPCNECFRNTDYDDHWEEEVPIK